MSLQELTSPLLNAPALQDLSLHDLELFLGLARHLKPTLSYTQPSYLSTPPPTLPANIQNFLVLSTGLPDIAIKLLWDAFRDAVWRHEASTQEHEQESAASCYIPLFAQHGISRDLAFYMIYPPTRVCLECARQPSLRAQELESHLFHKITVFSYSAGPVPGLSCSSYCRYCHTRYYPDYYVHSEATIRTYYATTVAYIQTAQHYFISSRLCEVFASMMVNAWASATNCARVYNEGMSLIDLRHHLPIDWPLRFTLNVEDVWNAFFLYSLLLDIFEQRDRGDTMAYLQLQHNAPSQTDRLQPALKARNRRIEGPGYEHWNHACDLCCWVFTDEDGIRRQLRSVVVDGVTLGHPCCAEHNCDVPLTSVKDKFCPVHRHRAKICAIVGCEEPTTSGHQTCRLPSHKALETWLHMHHKAMFQLKARLDRAGISQTNDAAGDPIDSLQLEGSAEGLEGAGTRPNDEDEIEVDENGLCEGKPQEGNRAVRARFGRRRTHNEELCVASCGVILGRATFYGSEAPNGVRTFLMKLFPTKAALPGVIWHDNNCQIAAMLRNEPDEYLRNYVSDCALPVDVFHFKSKHKAGDVNCNMYCNPALWPQLMLEDGKSWRFNSSAAEQTNAWFGGFQAIVREMQVDRYNFFLDEMIKRRNRQIVAKLLTSHQAPYSIPRHDLLDTR